MNWAVLTHGKTKYVGVSGVAQSLSLSDVIKSFAQTPVSSAIAVIS